MSVENPLLSIIFSGRVDSYEEDFISRMMKAVPINLDLLDKHEVDYEMIAVEWNPINQYFYDYPETASLFKNPRVKNLIVDKTAIEADGISTKSFKEYYAKNCGAARAKGRYLLLTNPDIFFSEDLVVKVKQLLESGLDPNKFYRTRYRHQYSIRYNQVVEKKDLHNPSWQDAHLAGAYSGDFLLVDKQSFFLKGRGYDEENPLQRGEKSQSNMDGEILSNMYHNGMRLEFINDPYFHCEHKKTANYQHGIFDHKYANKDTIGLTQYPEQWINDQVRVIYSEN